MAEALHSPSDEERPLFPRDRLAQKFPADKFEGVNVIGKLFPVAVMDSYINYERTNKTDARSNWYNWNPKILKYPDRWLIELVGCQGKLGIDSLKLGINMSVPIGFQHLVPYLHFKENPDYIEPGIHEEFKQFNVAGANLILFHDWQFDEIKKFVQQIK